MEVFIMPRISTFMYCEKAEPNQNGKLQIEQPLLALNPAFVPGMFSFSIVAGLTGVDRQMKHELRILFLSPEEGQDPLIDTGVLTIEADSSLHSKEEPINPLEDHGGLMFNLDFRNVVLKSEGVYQTVVIVDGDVLGEYPIYTKSGNAQ
jgi:hypothetical protein